MTSSSLMPLVAYAIRLARSVEPGCAVPDARCLHHRSGWAAPSSQLVAPLMPLVALPIGLVLSVEPANLAVPDARCLHQ
jgi:hypothetical protein